MRKSQLITSCAVFAGLSLGQSQVLAGWSGQMNGLGIGRATANATSLTQLPQAATKNTTAIGQVLGAAVSQGAPPPDYAFASLAGYTVGTQSSILGEKNYKWTAVTYAFGGDKTDNETVEEAMDVTPAPFAALTFHTEYNPDTRVLDFIGTATDGTGLVLQVLQTASSQTTFDVQSTDAEPDLENIFYQEHLGQGSPLASGQDSISDFHYTFTLPKDVPDTDLFVRIDGLATSTAPDSGSLGLAFALTVAGMALARRFVSVPPVAA